MKVKLAEALLRRKELQAKVDQLQRIKDKDLVYDIRLKRISVNDGLDEVSGQCPLLDINQVTAEFDYYARALRLVDACIQQTNWTADVVVDDNVFRAWSKPAPVDVEKSSEAFKKAWSQHPEPPKE
jgi:hypothetical protein